MTTGLDMGTELGSGPSYNHILTPAWATSLFQHPLAQQILIKLLYGKKKKKKTGQPPVKIHIKPEPPGFKEKE